MENEPIDILVLTPLPEELAALRGELGQAGDDVANNYFSYVIWRHVDIKDRAGGGCLIAVMPLEKDQIPAGNTTHLALNKWSPRCFALMGISGRLSTKVQLGDVVVGRHVLHWDAKRKERARAGEESQPAYSLTPVPTASWGANLGNLLKSDTQRYEEWKAHCARDRPLDLPERELELHVEDIASGSATIDSETERQRLSGLSRYLFAVETEAAAALSAFHQRNPNAPSILIRGVSDPSDGKSESDAVGGGAWRRYAARNAAKLLVYFLRSYEIPQTKEYDQHGKADAPTQQRFPIRKKRGGRTAVVDDSLRFVEGKIQTPIPWGKTNHSKYEISLKSVKRGWQREIEDAASRYFGAYLGQISHVYQIDEDSGSANFPVFSEQCLPILFRVNRRLIRPEAIQTIALISEHLYQHNVLPDSPVRDFFVPLKATAPLPQGCPGIGGFQGKVPYLTAYRYVSNANHYSGRLDTELLSVATEFARFQVALNHLPTEAPDIDLRPLEILRPDLSYDQSHPAQKYEEHKTTFLSETITYDSSYIPHGVLKNSDRLLRHAIEQLEGAAFLWETRDKPKSCAAYADFHPHNSLVDPNNGNCLLIYDFESCARQFNQDISLAFAVHRFTREWILQRGPASKDSARKATEIFLSGYTAGGGCVPQDFTKRLAALIRWANFHKLFFLYEVFLKKSSDFTARTLVTKWEEMRKFIMYIQEADFYENA